MQNTFPLFTLILCLLVQGYQAQAQVSIVTADLPTVGTTKNIKQENLPNVAVGTASSTAQTWNFSNLNGEPKTVQFVDATTTTATAEFPNSSMARVAPLPELLGIAIPNIGVSLDALQGTAYYHVGAGGRILNDGINLNLNFGGFSLGEQNIQTNPPDLYLAPLSYGQSISNSAEFEQTITIDIDSISPIPVPLSFVITTNRNVTADAFGTLQLPGAQQPYSVLRYNETGTIDLFAGVIVFGIPLYTLFDTSFAFQNYRFMTNGQQYPLVSLTGNPIGIGSEIATAEYINNGSVGIEDITTGTPLKGNAFPNPANNELSVQLPNNIADGKYRLQLYNTVGQKVLDADYKYATPQSVSHLPVGLYTYTLLHSADQQILLSGKVTIQH
jgi:hypothetical protein